MRAANNAPTKAEIVVRTAELDRREAELKSREGSARRADVAAFCDGLVKRGQLPPAERHRVAAFMDALPDSVVVIEFADGDPNKPVRTGAIDIFKSFLSGLPACKASTLKR